MPGGLQEITDDGFILLEGSIEVQRERSKTDDWMRPVSGEKLVYKVGG